MLSLFSPYILNIKIFYFFVTYKCFFDCSFKPKFCPLYLIMQKEYSWFLYLHINLVLSAKEDCVANSDTGEYFVEILRKKELDKI